MSKNPKSLSKYILDQNHFKDFEYEFDYHILRTENDTDYFGGNLTSALAEMMVFKDHESLAYFLAILSQSKILIPIDIYPPRKSSQRIVKRSECNFADIVPDIKSADETTFFSIFTSIREIHTAAHNHIFLYTDFQTAYKWIKKHREQIDVIAFDAFSNHEYAWFVKIDAFIAEIDNYTKHAKNYTGKNILADLYNISLQKHKTT